MNFIVKDITLYNIDKNRISINSGVDINYFPKQDWRELTENEFDILNSNTLEKNPNTQVSVVKISEEIIKQFSDLGIINVKTQQHVNNLTMLPLYKISLNKITDYISKYSNSIDNNITFNGFCYKNKDLLTVTTMYNTIEEPPLGLHIDNFSQKNYKIRGTVENRISINVGMDSRYLLLMNLSVKKIAELCGNENYHNKMNILRQLFMKKFNEYPVIRIKINPGEAYIAPTENIIHDGSTVGQRNCDLTLSFRGFFKHN